MSVFINGREIFNNTDINNPDIDGGTIDNTAIGGSTPAAGAFTTLSASSTSRALATQSIKGAAIVNAGFVGTVTAAASTTVTFSSAADAILAGYDATNPILGTTLISNALTRYIVSWTNSTTCVVNSSVTWAGTAITSVQLPIQTLVNSAGVTSGWVTATGQTVLRPTTNSTTAVQVQDASGTGILTVDSTNKRVGIGTISPTFVAGSGLHISSDTEANIRLQNTSIAQTFELRQEGNVAGLEIYDVTNSKTKIQIKPNLGDILFPNSNILTGGLTAAGTNAAKVLAMGSGTAPTTSPADAAQVWVADYAAGDARLYVMSEASTEKVIIGNGSIILGDAGKFTFDIAPASDHTASGSQFSATAGENLTYGQICYLKSDGKYWKADADAAATMPVTAMALASISADAAGNFLKFGWARDDSWAWTIGGLLYADTATAGGMTQTAPSGAADVIQVVGIAETATVVKFDPSPITTEVVLDSVSVSGTSQTITVADLLSEPITYYGDNSSDQTYTLTAFAAGDIGKKFTIMKTGASAGKAIIQLPASSYAYASGQASSAAGTVYLAASARGSMTWMITSTTTMQLVSADGSLTFV